MSADALSNGSADLLLNLPLTNSDGAATADVSDSQYQAIVTNDGGLTLEQNAWTYVPVGDFNGSVALSYEVSDGEFTVPVNTSITVTDVADPPEVIGSVALGSIQEDGSIMVTEAELLSHTTDADTNLSQLSIGAVTAVYPDGTEVSLTQQTVDIYEFDQNFTGDLTPLYEDLSIVKRSY